ncbi:monovalent cation/H(+) antiporter subunit G [Bacillus sp. DTU_2020_1000418_1_SI_GHA_SEK_038]|uniref:monovalent cation/H(+) antiporter subunit G n=1 Tax=Bacillus sp. DTU_2020_1000418_1_SI_GHA_SEK_038 TaxID=3077585 RepID=UPI0028E7E907|nr:monovalent cation/H(+) antiporter subunit G [Bacillus sp. DTU_2020_1000418_1_SI_GHA_SEK_038]WNS77646.1 monovalent cation/H(+) antiporter subunit G [Bacillus sp. DTU_2020_1000418_1_SI_GHA_SEK_038]
MIEIIRVLIALFIIIGAFLSLVAAFGVLRFPDVYTRNHAASKAATLGVMSILLGTFLYFYVEEGHFNSSVILGILFIFMTSPVAGHLISRASYNSGVKLWDKSVQDDLKMVAKAKEKK